MTAEQTVKLPPDIADRFRPADRFIVWAEGDALHLKRITPCITPPAVSQMVEQAPEGEPLSLDQIDEIVHQVWRP